MNAPASNPQEFATALCARIASTWNNYAVFHRGDKLKALPTEGNLYKRHKDDDEYMATLVGVYAPGARAQDIADDIEAAS